MVKSAKTQRRFKGKDLRDRMDHHYIKPFTGFPALFHAVIHRAILDCMFIYPKDDQNFSTSYAREVLILEEARVKAYNWLFTDGLFGVNTEGRAGVCDLANVDTESFEEVLPKVKEVIDYIQVHGEYDGNRPQEVARWISGMLIRASLDETAWQEILDQ